MEKLEEKNIEKKEKIMKASTKKWKKKILFVNI